MPKRIQMHRHRRDVMDQKPWGDENARKMTFDELCARAKYEWQRAEGAEAEAQALHARIRELEATTEARAQIIARNRCVVSEAEAAARIRELEDDERKRASESGQWFGEILAVIHGDGGQHLDENGPEISARNAIAVWYGRTAQIDALEAELERRAEAAGARIRILEAALRVMGVDPSTLAGEGK